MSRSPRLAQRAETEFVGAPVGIMDQMAASLGRAREALFLDTRTLRVSNAFRCPRSLELVVIDSGVAHQHAGGEIRDAAAESSSAPRAARASRAARRCRRSVCRGLAALPPLLARRARHVVTENERVLAAVAALRQAMLARLGALFDASHASMRDDYEVSTPEIDVLVDCARTEPDVYGARLTGGGFGGAIVAIAARRPGVGRRRTDPRTATARRPDDTAASCRA